MTDSNNKNCIMRDKLDITFDPYSYRILEERGGKDETVRQLGILSDKFRHGVSRGFIPQTFRSTMYSSWFALTLVDPRGSLHGCTIRIKPTPMTSIDEAEAQAIADELDVLADEAGSDTQTFIRHMTVLRNK